MAVDSQRVVKTLLEVDPQFAALCDTLFGKAVDAADVWTYLYTSEGVSKMNPAPSDVATHGGAAARGLKATGRVLRRNAEPVGAGLVAGVAANQLPQRGAKRKVAKNESTVVWDVEFTKVDEDKRQVFGWASIVKMDGKPVIDRQGDWITPEEIEKAAYTYVVKNRTGGHQHKRSADDQPFKASDMIESVVFTDEKIAKMGLPDDFPRGWWVGYHVSDDEAWAKIKNREVTGFSIHGKGKRQEVLT